MRILVIGSSITLPNSELSYENTWLYSLKQDFPELELVDRSYNASSAVRLITDGPGGNGKDSLDYFSPDVVITQIGADDAMPRMFKRDSIVSRILVHLPGSLSSIFYSLVTKLSNPKSKNSDLTPTQFRNYFDKYCQRASSSNVKVFIVEICRAAQAVVLDSPQYNENINLFNEQLHIVANKNDNAYIINALDSTDSNDFQTDGIHLTPQGQKKQYALIKEALLKEGII